MADRAPNLRSSIYLGADGRWHGYVTLGVKDDGSPDRRHRSGKTQAEVTRKVQELERRRDQGKAGKPGRPLTVAGWFETWLTTIAPRTVSQGTLDSSYAPKVRHWIIPQLGKRRLDRLQPEHLDVFYTNLARQGLKPNTIVQIHRIISRALKVAWKRGQVAVNVAALVDAPIGEEVDIEALTAEEACRILTVAAIRRNGARWSVAFAIGVRQSEAIGLRWQYVDLDEGTIEVGWQLRRARYRHGCVTRTNAPPPVTDALALATARNTSTSPTARTTAPHAATAAGRSSGHARPAASATAASARNQQAAAGTSLAVRASSQARARPSSSSRFPHR